MELAIIAGKTLTGLGINVLIGTVSSLASTTSNICGLIKNINGIGRHNITRSIKKLDIEVTISIIDSMLRQIIKEKVITEPIIASMDAILKTTKLIESELAIIHKKMAYNNRLVMPMFFETWRTYDYSRNVSNLEDYKIILDNRKLLLFESLQIKNEQSTGEHKIENTKLLEKEVDNIRFELEQKNSFSSDNSILTDDNELIFV